ncbi:MULTISPECIES: GNAT family N-acetyltransferase [unclassified Sphingomonas]|uniref:GNAT family N-acetyltransferase n=1 Tax=unclassified Sphingomonas TaxID=196159 RepID=UPI0007015CE8|nr:MULTISPECIES: GNAT family N-acetyltransferase [unclassified Sphingomonas]KQM64016.1 GCN5 family acetyltransferase [Sphingomonas sp. Leaf16]KQN13389.1 GCN5 family acetyltransferase [Sphingomonas sp. Leaf29]KQN21311.1 GCN5 family acetyltransferase [Sphingomonas sp. Leaf32]
MTIEVVASPGEDDRLAILAALVDHNDAAVGRTHRRQVAIVVRDDAGAIIGGLWGMIGYRWLFVQYLALPEAVRGQGIGRRLMEQAEAEARADDCIGIWLDTFSFQARGFYEKLAFAHFGTIDDFPPGHARFFLSKRID